MIRPVQKNLYAVIGNPVDHSLSPVMMNAVFEALKIPAVYLALQVDDLAEDLATLGKLGVRGLSVTIPHKESAFRVAINLDEPSQTMGAVNTLRLQNGQWEGCNTDWIGAIAALCYEIDRIPTPWHSGAPLPDSGNPIVQADTPTHHSSLITRHSLSGKHALVIGAGGVARAIVYGLKHEGAAITVSNRGIERGEALARAFDCAFVPLSELPHAKGKTAFDIIVQCTPVGLMHKEDPALVPDALLPRAQESRVKGQEPTAKSQPPRAKSQEPRADFTLIPDSFLRPGTVVMDTVYRPLWTPFLRKARARGCIAVSGVEMLLHQGVAQLQWWFGDLIRPEVVLPIMGTALMGVLKDE